MPAFQARCPVCGDEYTSSTSVTRIGCCVGCQFYAPQLPFDVRAAVKAMHPETPEAHIQAVTDFTTLLRKHWPEGRLTQYQLGQAHALGFTRYKYLDLTDSPYGAAEQVRLLTDDLQRGLRHLPPPDGGSSLRDLGETHTIQALLQILTSGGTP